MNSEERIKVLAKHLDADAELIEESTYQDNLFIVNPRKAKRGTSPREAKRLVSQLRDVLESVFPTEETQKWNSDFFLREHFDHSRLKKEIDSLEVKLERAEKSLPRYKSPFGICEKCNWIDKTDRHRKCQKCKGAIIMTGTPRYVRRIDLDKMDKKLRAECEPKLKCIEELEHQLTEKEYEAKGHFTYDGITAAITVREPGALQIGTHEVANTLYFLTPKADDSSQAQDHRTTLREVFDRLEPEDRREDYDTDSGSYMVLTDDEADERRNEYLDSYIDGCVLPEMPENMREYFNADSFKEDSKAGGRGQSMGSYDGHEHEYDVDGESLFIYRMN